MSIFSSYKKIFLLGFIIVILIAIPLSVYVAQQRQRTITKAAASTVLSFEPASSTIEVDKLLALGIILDPGTGSTANQVSFVKLSISFDPEKFTTVTDSLAPNLASPNTLTSVLEDPVYASGSVSISLSIGADPTKVVTTKTKIAILQLKALAVTSPNNPSSITFNTSNGKTQVLSIASSDQTSENVLNLLSTNTPATVTITSAATSLSPTPTITPVPATTTATPTPLPGSTLQPTPTSSPSAVFTPTPIVVQPTPTTIILPPTGPGENILSIGAIGVIFTIIGTALLILL